MILSVKTNVGEYPIVLKRGALSELGKHFNLARRCMVVTDENIPGSFVENVLSQCGEGHLFVIRPGENTKSLKSFEECIELMLKSSFTRSDCVVALGGGVVGDLAGFVASAFCRGVDFYNIPTTVLSQVDSSIGGKVAVNVMGLKNMVGAFYPPKGVLIDPDTLSTLPWRQIANGLAESVKMALTFDEELFSLLETTEDPMTRIETIIEKSLLAKKRVVEEDEREAGLRKVLNFGHTLAHALESESFRSGKILYHGECVALGMIPMVSNSVRDRLLPVLEKLGLPTKFPQNGESLLSAMAHDKKISGDRITVIRVDKIGSYEMEEVSFSRFAEEMRGWNG